MRRLILCSGKVYVDLVSSEQREKAPAIAIARVEQLYRFPADELKQLIAGYPALAEVVWLQEEPANMGAWEYVRPRLSALLDGRSPLRFIGRPENASPAEGSAAWHAANQQLIVKRAYNLEPVREQDELPSPAQA